VYYHGGGFVLGDTKMYEHITTSVAANTHATVVFIDYRLAPEHKFPSGIDTVSIF
jgi:acetyl esterase